MKQLIENVVQWGRDRGLDKVGHLAQAKYTLKETAELLDAYADQDIAKINDAIGDIAVTLIVGASNDVRISYELKIELLKKLFRSSNKSKDFIFIGAYAEFLDASSHLFKYSDKLNKKLMIPFCYKVLFYKLNYLLLIINNEFNQSLSLQDCLQLAYDEIKDRTGKLVDGQFIKD